MAAFFLGRTNPWGTKTTINSCLMSFRYECLGDRIVHSRQYAPLFGFDMADWLFLFGSVALVTLFAEVFVL